jgi:hypothetical protein
LFRVIRSIRRAATRRRLPKWVRGLSADYCYSRRTRIRYVRAFVRFLDRHGWATVRQREEAEAAARAPAKEVGQPEEWKPLPPDFCQAARWAVNCAGHDKMLATKYVNLGPEWVEASDNWQAVRWYTRLPLGRGRALLLAGKLGLVVALGVTEVGETELRVHFRNPADVQPERGVRGMGGISMPQGLRMRSSAGPFCSGRGPGNDSPDSPCLASG